MICLAVVRVSGIHSPNKCIGEFDGKWEDFWQQTEASVAVLMVSITAFRSMFGTRAFKAQANHRVWARNSRAMLGDSNILLDRGKSQGSDLSRSAKPLPPIPGGTWTRIRDFI